MGWQATALSEPEQWPLTRAPLFRSDSSFVANSKISLPAVPTAVAGRHGPCVRHWSFTRRVDARRLDDHDVAIDAFVEKSNSMGRRVGVDGIVLLELNSMSYEKSLTLPS